MNVPGVVRRSHCLFRSVWLLFIGIALTLEFVGGPESQLVTLPIVITLVGLIITGIYMLAKPWVIRFRAA